MQFCIGIAWCFNSRRSVYMAVEFDMPETEEIYFDLRLNLE
jgi:hypothetical protein